jgi:hypothetical protein
MRDEVVTRSSKNQDRRKFAEELAGTLLESFQKAALGELGRRAAA